MNFKPLFPILLLVTFAVLLGCAAQEKVVREPPAFPEGVAGAKWGMPVKEVKDAVETFQDDTEKSPFALYASRKQFDLPAIVSYFFTPRSRRLYRTDVTFNDPGVYGAVRGKLVEMFKNPAFTQPGVDVFLWKDDSVLIVQNNPNSVQVSFWNGPLSKLNKEEGGEPLKTLSERSFWKALFGLP